MTEFAALRGPPVNSSISPILFFKNEIFELVGV